MIKVLKKVASDDVKNLVSGTVSKVEISMYVDLDMEDARYQMATDIETGYEVFLVYQGGSFWLECGEYMLQLCNSSDDDEDVVYHIELGDYDCAAEMINSSIILIFSREWTYIDLGRFYVPLVHYLQYCFSTPTSKV